ncbi:MAG: VCBS repeat-containing protein, partial [Ignavibacteriales bacterium]|nr:VCBS repeat-containing protein [Ignavibacteriales bacterium]
MKYFILSLCFIIEFSQISVSQIQGKQNSFPKRGRHEFKKFENLDNDWFMAQRSYPNNDIPRGALQQMRVEMNEQFANSTNKTGNTNMWQLAGPSNIGGRINSVLIHPTNQNILYGAAASGGVWRSTDFGETWDIIFNESFSIGTLAFEPGNPNIIYVGTGEANPSSVDTYPGNGIWRSTDEGATWTNLGLAETGHIGKIVVNPSNTNTIYVAALGLYRTKTQDKGVFKSTNRGSSWNRILFVNDSTGATDILLDPIDANRILVATWTYSRQLRYVYRGGTGSGLYLSTNAGAGWSQITNGFPNNDANLGRIALAVAPSNSSIVYANVAGGSAASQWSGVYKSTDRGSSWTKTFDGISTGESQVWYNNIIAVNPRNADSVWAGGTNFYLSTDGGYTFTYATINGDYHVDHHALEFAPWNTDVMVLGNDGGIYISPNSGTDWTKSYNLPITQFYAGTISPHNASQLLGGAQDNNTIRTYSSGHDSWFPIFGGDGFNCLIDPNDSNYVYVEYQNGGLVYSTDGGASFNYGRTGIITSEPVNWQAPIAMDMQHPKTLYTGTNSLYRTKNNMQSWTKISSDLTYTQPSFFSTISTIDVAQTDSNVIYVGTGDGRVWVTTNGGTNWNDIASSLPLRWVSRVTVDPTNANIAYVTLSGFREYDFEGHIYRTTNYGTIWTNIGATLPDVPLNDVIVDPMNTSQLFIASDISVLYTTNLGERWLQLGNNLPAVPVHDLSLHSTSRTLAAFTHGRSVWTVDVTNLVLPPPVVNSTSPVQNALSSSKAANITATFNVAMNTTRFTANNILVYGMQSGKHNGTITLQGDTAFTFNPTDDFVAGEIVNVSLTNNITNATGDSLTNGYHWSFTIETSFSSGTFYSRTDYPTGPTPYGVFSYDIDNDSDCDIVTANVEESYVSVLRNDGSGSFGLAEIYFTDDYVLSVFVSDVDNDGDGDIISTSAFSDNVTVYFNDGFGIFSGRADYPTDDFPVSVFVYDLNGDGDGDIVSANNDSYTVSILMNHGNGTFSPRVDYAAGISPNSIFISDIDSDSDGDIIIACSAISVVSVMKNNGDGTFATRIEYPSNGRPISVFVSDIDGDGDGDIIAPNQNTNDVSVLKNNGDGTFQSNVNYFAGAAPNYIYVGDFDGDKDEDIAVSNQDTNTISILFNNGNGTFQAKTVYEIGYGPRGITGGDVDNDGDLDLIVGNYYEDYISVLTNAAAHSFFISSTDVDFGTVCVGSSNTKNVIVFNRGVEPLHIDSINIPIPQLSVSPPNATIPPGDSLNFLLTYTPTNAVEDSFYVEFNHNLAYSPKITTVKVKGGLSFKIIAVSGTNGAIFPSGLVSTNCGTNRQFIITPDSGYQVDSVLVNGLKVDSTSSYTFENVLSHQSIEATFKVKEFTLTVSAIGEGTISPSGQIIAQMGQDVTFTVSPNSSCYKIAMVTVDEDSVASSSLFTLNNILAEHTIVAYFTLKNFTVTALTSENGRILPPGTSNIFCGDSIVYSIIPDSGYRIVDVVIDGESSVGVVSSYTFKNVSSAHIISASFTFRNDVPFVSTFADSIEKNRSKTITLTGQDPEGGSVTFFLDDQPLNGTIRSFNSTTGEVLYRPDYAFVGLDSFSFYCRDSLNAISNTAWRV